MIHVWYSETVEVEPTTHSLQVTFDAVQHRVELSQYDTRETVIEKLLDFAIGIEDELETTN
jgi:hypothetical protein